MKYLIIISLFSLSGCAGLNPNLGERTSDTFWHQGNIASAARIIIEKANSGYPWAQLRLGVMYELGSGVEKNIPEAIKWYEKAASQKSEGNWAEGILIGTHGQQGFFNQNGDARIAQYQLANIYLKGEGITKNNKLAYKNIAPVVKETKGQPIFYCCEFAGGKYIVPNKIKETYDKAISELSEKEISKLNTELGL